MCILRIFLPVYVLKYAGPHSGFYLNMAGYNNIKYVFFRRTFGK